MSELKPLGTSSRLGTTASAEVSDKDQHSLGRSAQQTMTTTTVSPASQSIAPGAEGKTKRSTAWKTAPNLLVSFRYAWAGVRYAFLTQRNFRIHAAIGTLALGLGAFLQVSAVEMAVVALTSALVMALELVNTAIESAVDLTVKRTYHDLAKIAKDCAAAAVLVAAIAAVVVAGLILLPPLLARLGI